jgi:hypothetical protein
MPYTTTLNACFCHGLAVWCWVWLVCWHLPMAHAQTPEAATVVENYPAYVRHTHALTQKLIDLGPKLSGQWLSLQQLVAITHDLHLMRTPYQWERGEANLFSLQLINTALAALDDATQFWLDGNELRYLIGENESYYPFNRAYIQQKLALVLHCIEDLKTLQTLRTTLDQPTLRYQKRPEFSDPTFPTSTPPQLHPSDPLPETAPPNLFKPPTP